MFNRFVQTTFLSCSLLMVVNVQAADPIAIVNGEAITQEDYENYITLRATQIQGTADEDRLIDEMVQRKLLQQAAMEQKIDQSPEFKLKMEELKFNLLLSTMVQKYLEEHPIEDALLKETYDVRMAKINNLAEYKVRHILVKTETEAQAIIAEIEQGRSFGQLAKEKSIDPGSADKEGDVGWISEQKMFPEFAEAVKNLEKGQYTKTPVKTQFGWHIIQLEDTREVPLPSFDNVRAKIKTMLQEQLIQKYLTDLKEKAQIEIIKSETKSEEETDSSNTEVQPETTESPKEAQSEEKTESSTEIQPKTEVPPEDTESPKEVQSEEAEPSKTEVKAE